MARIRLYDQTETMKQHCHETAACYLRLAMTVTMVMATYRAHKTVCVSQGLRVIHPPYRAKQSQVLHSAANCT